MDKLELFLSLAVIICLAIGQGLLASFVLLLAAKWNFLEWYDIHRAKWMPIRCEFCISFWMAVLMTGAWAYFEGFSLWYLAIPPMAATVNWVNLKGE